jgi:hypothetical protein
MSLGYETSGYETTGYETTGYETAHSPLHTTTHVPAARPPRFQAAARLPTQDANRAGAAAVVQPPPHWFPQPPLPAHQYQPSSSHPHPSQQGGPGWTTRAPPPPPSPVPEDVLSNMLCAWYESGYHTGYFRALQDMGFFGNSGAAPTGVSAAPQTTAPMPPPHWNAYHGFGHSHSPFQR